MTNGAALHTALGNIRDSFLEEAESLLERRQRMPLYRLAAACLALLLIAMPVGAEAKNGYISNLLAPLYGGAQTEIVDNIGVPIGASVTVGDYTLTADAVIGDRYNLAIVYSLTHVDGAELSEWLRFDGWESTGARGNGGYLNHQLSEDGKTMYLTEQWTGNQRLFLFKRDFQVEFTNLVIFGRGEAENIPVQEGLWQLRFPIRYEDTMKTVWRGKRQVTGSMGSIFTIRRVEVSPLGLHIKLDAPSGYIDRLYQGQQEFSIRLLLQDGTLRKVEDFGGGGHGKSDAETLEYTIRVMFDTPVPKGDLKSLVICGTEFLIT